jgi:hypothetical protein
MKVPWQVLDRELERTADDIQELHREGVIHVEPIAQIGLNRPPRGAPARTADCAPLQWR